MTFGQLLLQFRKSDYALTCRAIKCGKLLRGILTPRQVRSTLQLFVDHDWHDTAIRERFIYAVVIITLGLMTFGVWYEWDSGNAGQQHFGDFLKRESSKWGC